MDVETVELVHGQSVDCSHDVGDWEPVSGDVHVKSSVGKLGGIGDDNGCHVCIDAATRRVLIEQLFDTSETI